MIRGDVERMGGELGDGSEVIVERYCSTLIGEGTPLAPMLATTISGTVRRLSLLLSIVLLSSACSSDDAGLAPYEPTTTAPEQPCTVDNGCLPAECADVTIQADPWTLHSSSGAAGTHRVSSRVVVTGGAGCASINDSRIALQGVIDGEEADLFGEREGAIGYELIGELEREVTMVVHCDDSLPEVGVMVTPAVGDDEALPIVETIALSAEDCARSDPATGFAGCELEVSGEVRDVLRDTEELGAAVITVGLVGESCPDPSGLLEPVYLGEVYADNLFADDPWKYQSPDGTPGVLMTPTETGVAEYVWRCNRAGRVFDRIDFEVVAFFEDQQFATGNVSVNSVPCHEIVEDTSDGE